MLLNHTSCTALQRTPTAQHRRASTLRGHSRVLHRLSFPALHWRVHISLLASLSMSQPPYYWHTVHSELRCAGWGTEDEVMSALQSEGANHEKAFYILVAHRALGQSSSPKKVRCSITTLCPVRLCHTVQYYFYRIAFPHFLQSSSHHETCLHPLPPPVRTLPRLSTLCATAIASA
jgi:hypothetical protein